MTYIYLLLATLATGLVSEAAEMPKFETPEVLAIPGEPIRIKWTDGRVATLQRGSLEPFGAKVPIEITENLCTFQSGQVCGAHLYLKKEQMRVIWTSHPDPEKIGKLIRIVKQREVKDSTGTVTSQETVQTIEMDETYGNTYSGKTDIHRADIPQESIECQDFSWLPGSVGPLPPSALTIAHWGAESMVTNPETGRDENRVVFGAFGLKFAKRDSTHLDIVEVLSWYDERETPFGQLLNGDALSLFIEKDSGGDICQITMKPNLQIAQGLASEYTRKEITEFQDQVFIESDTPLRQAVQNLRSGQLTDYYNNSAEVR